MRQRVTTTAGLLLLVAVVAASVALAQEGPAPGSSPKDRSGEIFARVPDLEAKLATLQPSDPQAYFRLAEEVADEADEPQGVQLARTLYVLAYELSTSKGTDSDLGASVCLGLAVLASSDGERRWLSSLAESLGRQDRPEPNWSPPTPGPSQDEAAFDLATALGLIRAGDGARAETYMNKPGVRDLLEKYDTVLAAGGMSADSVLRDMELWPHCPQCFERGMNQRVIRRADGYILCPTCGGNPGPVLTTQQLITQLRLESLLLSGVHRSWAAQYAVDGGAPLRDLDPAELAGTYGVDKARPCWRDGAWVAAPGAAGPAKTPSPAGTPAGGGNSGGPGGSGA